MGKKGTIWSSNSVNHLGPKTRKKGEKRKAYIVRRKEGKKAGTRRRGRTRRNVGEQGREPHRGLGGRAEVKRIIGNLHWGDNGETQNGGL